MRTRSPHPSPPRSITVLCLDLGRQVKAITDVAGAQVGPVFLGLLL